MSFIDDHTRKVWVYFTKHKGEVFQHFLNFKVMVENLPNYFWVEVVATIVYIMNQTPTPTIRGMTLEEKFTGKKPNVSHLIVFSCITYMHVLDEKR